MLWTILAIVVLLYAGFLALLYARQRSIVFRPDTTRADLAAAGLSEQMTEVGIETADGLTLHSWWAPPVRPDGRVIVYFHGNAGHRGGRAARIRDYLANGYGVLLVGYRGYGGNPGRLSEAGVYTDARANLAFVTAQKVRPEQIVLFGESLGTAVATQMALELPALALVLEAPLASILHSARARYPLFAFGPLIKDKFDSLSKIRRVKLPLLIVHGERDRTTLVKFGRMLHAAANEPKQGVFLPEADHNNLIDHGLAKLTMEFVEKLPART
ncbi:MAG TPA: alpha/beta hydrolase [Dongiaceae bacterium]|jgi:fermentation-respiration switch protein FrsA (DUF1100 family)|nr:alpha/beta hydrolase [Dongiaceae bacterium]